MKTTIIFIHSAGPQGHNQGTSGLVTYLKEELKDKCHFINPIMPTPEDPKYQQWKEQIDEILTSQTGKIILVGHSLGGSVLLKYLSEELLKMKIAGLFIVAAPFWGIDEEWQRQDFILNDQFDEHLKCIPNLFLYHSINEEIVPFSHHLAYAKKLPHGRRRELEGSDHLFLEGLPELIADIDHHLK